MPNFAPNYTPRVRVTYRVQGALHRLVARIARGSDISAAETAIADLDTAISQLNDRLYVDWEFVGADFCDQDSNLFDPLAVSFSLTVGTIATGTRPGTQKALELTCPYRTSNNGHGFVALYGTGFSPGTEGSTGDFRVTAGEDADVLNFIEALQSAPWVGGNNNSARFKNYVNIHFNRRWERRVRNG